VSKTFNDNTQERASDATIQLARPAGAAQGGGGGYSERARARERARGGGGDELEVSELI